MTGSLAHKKRARFSRVLLVPPAGVAPRERCLDQNRRAGKGTEAAGHSSRRPCGSSIICRVFFSPPGPRVNPLPSLRFANDNGAMPVVGFGTSPLTGGLTAETV